MCFAKYFNFFKLNSRSLCKKKRKRHSGGQNDRYCFESITICASKTISLNLKEKHGVGYQIKQHFQKCTNQKR